MENTIAQFNFITFVVLGEVGKMVNIRNTLLLFGIKRIKYCTETLKNIYLYNIVPVYSEIMSITSDFIKK